MGPFTKQRDKSGTVVVRERVPSLVRTLLLRPMAANSPRNGTQLANGLRHFASAFSDYPEVSGLTGTAKRGILSPVTSFGRHVA